MPPCARNKFRPTTLSRNASVLILLTAAAFVLVRFPARVVDVDAVIYASAARIGAAKEMASPGHLFKEVANPGHLGFYPLELAANVAGQRMIPPANSIFLLQYVSMLAGLAGGYVFYRTLRETGLDRRRSVLLTSVLLFSYAYWHFSLQAESHILATFFLILFLRAALRFFRSPTPRAGAVAGVALGLATLLHQTSILVAPCFLAGALVLAGRRRPIPPLRPFLLSYLAIVALPYLLVGWIVLGLRTPAGFRHWIMGLSQWGKWGWWTPANPVRAVSGLIRSFVGSHFFLGLAPIKAAAERVFPHASWEDEVAIAASVPVRLRYVLAGLAAGVFAVSLAVAVRGAAGLRRAFCGDAGLAVFLAAWIAVSAGFSAWWAPQHTEFWLPLFAPVLVLLTYSFRDRRGARLGWAWCASLFVLALFAVNFWGSIYPESLERMEPETLAALAIEAAVEPGGIVITDTDLSGRATRYVRAFEKVDLVGLCVASPTDGSGAERADPISGERSPDECAAAAIDSILAAADGTAREVYLLAHPLSTDEHTIAVYGRLVTAIADRFDVTQCVPVRAAVDLRRVRRRGDRADVGVERPVDPRL